MSRLAYIYLHNRYNTPDMLYLEYRAHIMIVMSQDSVQQ